MAYTDYLDTVQKAYIAYYQRPGDPEGLAFWARMLDNNGGDESKMIEAFANSQEAQDLYGNITEDNIDQVITAIYQAAFNRAPEAGGLEFYHNGFVHGDFTPATIMLNIVDGAQNEDKICLENKVVAADEFSHMIDPNLDTDMGAGPYTTTYDSADIVPAREFLAQVSAQVNTIPSKADTIKYIQEHIADAGDPILEWTSGETYTLTAQADHIIGTAGDDLVIGNAATLNAGDSIVGDGGNDTLKYSSDVNANHSAWEMRTVENMVVTSDNNSNNVFDMSGAEGVDKFSTLNSTGDVIFNHVTKLANLEVNNLTADNNLVTAALHFADSVVAGSDDAIELDMVNNVHAKAGVIQIGSDSTGDKGIETINLVTSGAASHINQLDSDISTLNISGDQALEIETPLNSTVDTVNASGLSADLDISLVGNVAAKGEGALSVTGGSANDTIHMFDVARDANVNLGEGNDVLEAGMGHDNIQLGAGDDNVFFKGNDALTVDDTVDGGAGVDTMHIEDESSITKSEAEKVSSIENVDLIKAGAIDFVVTDHMLDTLSDTNKLTIYSTETDDKGNVTNSTANQTIDISNVSFNKTNEIVYNGSKASGVSDTVIADDATVNAKATLNFSQNDGAADAAAKYYSNEGDVLVIRNEGTFTADDFSGVTGLDQIHLQSDSNVAQTWDLVLTPGMIDNYDTTNAAGDNKDDLVIYVDRTVPQGSVVKVDASALKATQHVTVLTNSNVTVQTTGTAAQIDTQTVLEFTENADNLQGTANDDIFTANSLDQLQAADNADGKAGVDTMRVDFAISNASATIKQAFNNANISNIEKLVFNTDNDVKFKIDGGSYDFNDISTGSGADLIMHTTSTSGSPITYHTDGGNDELDTGFFTSSQFVFDAGKGDDTLVMDDQNDMNFANYIAGEGTDELKIMDQWVDGSALAAGDIDSYMGTTAVTTADLEKLYVKAAIDDFNNPVDAKDVVVRFNNKDIHEFTDMKADVTLSTHGYYNSDNGTDVGTTGFSGAQISEGSSALKVSADAWSEGTTTANPPVVTDLTGAVALVGGPGNDILTVVHGQASGTVNGFTDKGGVAGLRGADKIVLEKANGLQDNVVYKTSHDGAIEGQDNGGFDTVYNFEANKDKVVFAQAGGNYKTAADYGNGFLGDAVSADATLDAAALNAATVDVTTANTDEIAAYTNTGLSDAELEKVSEVGAWLAQNVALQNDAIGAARMFVVQSDHNTGLYWFTSENADADIQANELSLIAVFEDTHITDADFTLA